MPAPTGRLASLFPGVLMALVRFKKQGADNFTSTELLKHCPDEVQGKDLGNILLKLIKMGSLIASPTGKRLPGVPYSFGATFETTIEDFVTTDKFSKGVVDECLEGKTLNLNCSPLNWQPHVLFR